MSIPVTNRNKGKFAARQTPRKGIARRLFADGESRTLHRHALADEEWRVRPLAGRGVAMAGLDTKAIAAGKGIAALPPVLKAYLRAGAKFGGGAVIDAQFGTTGVFALLPLGGLEERYQDYCGGPMEMPNSYVA